MCENALSLRDYKGKASFFKSKPWALKKAIKNTTSADAAENQMGYGSIKIGQSRASPRYKQEKLPRPLLRAPA